MHSNNISRIEKVAKGLGSINEEVVYVGGSVAEFYVIDLESLMSGRQWTLIALHT